MTLAYPMVGAPALPPQLQANPYREPSRVTGVSSWAQPPTSAA